MAWLGRLARAGLWVVAVTVLILGGAFVALTRTDVGASYAMERLTGYLEGRMKGTLRIGGVSTGDLLAGVTLRDVEILDPSGRPFVRLDSARARYSALGLLGGQLVFRDVRLWGPDLTVERLPEWETLNVYRIFPPVPSQPDTARARSGGGRIAFRDVRIEGGRVRAFLPLPDGLPDPEGAFVVSAPDGRRLRRYTFSDIRGDLPSVVVSEPGMEGEEAEVESLSLVAEAIREPVRLVDLRGEVRRVGSSVTIRAGTLRLPDSEAAGTIRAAWGEAGTTLAGDLRADDVSLADLRWLLPDLPDGRGRADAMTFEMGPAGSTWEVENGVVSTPESRVEATGGLDLADRLRFRGMQIRAAPLALSRLNPWLEEDTLPLSGSVRGDLRLDGSLDGLSVGGELTLDEPGHRSTSATVSGVVRLGDGLGFSGFEAVAEPLDWRLARRFAPAVNVAGGGRLEVELDGRLEQGLSLTVLARHEAPDVGRSRIDAQGTVRADSSRIWLDVDGEVDPLRFAVLRPYLPERDLNGEVEGSVRLRGPLQDLRVEAELATGRGEMSLDTRFDATDPGAGYELTGVFRGFRLSGLFPEIPDPTLLSGSLEIRGRGLRRETLDGEASIRLRSSQSGLLAVDSATLALRTEAGALRIDTLRASTNLARIDGGGRIGLTVPGDDAELRLTVVNDSLLSLRPFLYGDTVIAGDRLSPLDREALISRGVDPDTLPTATSVALDGRLRGQAVLRGAVDDFSVEGALTVEELVHGPNYLREGRATFSAEGLPGLDGRFDATLTADSIRWEERRFEGGEAELHYRRPKGRARVLIRRSESEDYRALVAFNTDSVGGEAHLDEMVLRFDTVRWNLGGPASVRWSEDGFAVQDFRLIRPGVGGMRIRADGRIPLRGDADFDLSVEGLSLSRLAGLVQTSEEVGGSLDLSLRIDGTAASPLMEGTLAMDSVRFRNVRMSRVDGEIRYRDRALSGRMEAWRDSLLAARVEGSFPVDLALRGAGDRIRAEPMNLAVVVDSFPVAVLATVVDAVDNVRGTVAGEVRVGGTPNDVQPAGSLQLQDAGFTVPGLGIQPSEVSGTVTLNPDGSARMDLQGRSGGQATVGGTVGLDPITDPSLDLTIRASGFQAIDRRDLSARLGGEASLTGTFRQPVLEGAVEVNRGNLFLEEFERSADVVDLSDPAFFDVVDTTDIASVRPVLQASQNPFLQNLRMNVDVRVERNTWLRSRDMNVEMGGELTVNFDRSREVFVVQGQLNAIRGTYSAFGRQFQVREGMVEFVGTPDLNPNLNIGAITRLRTSQGEPLTITATVSGTLLEPRISLSSDAQPPIAQSDLVSYLIFGRPSFALGSGESAVLQGAAGQIVGAAGSLGLGAVANQLGSTVRETGLADYFAVTEAPGGSIGGAENPWAATQVEAGWYLDQNLFLALLLRPLAGQGTAARGQSRFAGSRLEWRLGDLWTVEGFAEDQFSREGISGFGSIGYQLSRIFGFFVYRDWGY